MPMMADFAVRLACGLAILLLATSWRLVPLAFFRTHCLVMLGLLVLAALASSRPEGFSPAVALIVTAAVLAYLAFVAWGLGLPRLGLPLTVLLVMSTAGFLIVTSRGGRTGLWLLEASGRLSSAFLMGSTLTAMLLGHHYLTAPAMSIAPLRRFVRCMAWSLGLRALVAGVALWVWLDAGAASHSAASLSPFFLAIRWGVGLVGTAVATALTWKTVEIRSTQSATGILYVAMTLVLFGELTAPMIAHGGGCGF
jgi:hypothetical protein